MEILAFLNESQKIGSDRTRECYHSVLRKFNGFLFDEHLDIDEAEPGHIELFANRVKNSINPRTGKPGVSDSTVKFNLSAVSSHYNWRQLTGKSARNPVKGFKYRRTERPRVVLPITPEVATAMCRLSKNSKKIAIVKLFRRSGIRVDELRRMNKDSIKTEVQADGSECGIVNVIGKGRKKRRVYVSPDALDAIADYLAERGDDSEMALFISRPNRQVCTRTIERWIKSMAEAAGDNNGHPHRLRHSFSSEMAAGGMPERDLMDRLGHEDNATTQRYIYIDDDKLIADCKRVLRKIKQKLAA